MGSKISVCFPLSLTVSETAFLVDQNFAQILQNARPRQICFGYIPKTNQIAGKAYQTTLYSKIEHLKPGSACPAPTKKIKKNKKFKGKKKASILIPQDKEIKK